MPPVSTERDRRPTTPETAPAPPGTRIAIVGSGVSGLVAAWLLRDTHAITVFEAGPSIGGHTNTIEVAADDGPHHVDTGFVVFNHLNYPNFTRLLERLDVASQPTTMSFSVQCERTGLEYNGTSLNGLFAQRRNLFRPRFLGMVRDILRFNREAPALLDRDDETTTVGDYVDANGYGRAFVEQYLLPMGASIWSCPAGTFRRFPVRFVVDFFNNHRMLSVNDRPAWRTVTGGAQRYVDALTRSFRDRFRLETPVRAVSRDADAVRIRTDRDDERFDHVILACHADQSLALLDDPTPAEREILRAFPYQANEALLHTDTTVLPKRRRAWASWNYHLPATERDRVGITYDMNILQRLPAREEYCVTLNDDGRVDPERILRRLAYDHPIYTAGRAAAQARHDELLGTNRTSYCGAYWGYGFHEDGVNSGLAVAKVFGRALA